MRLEILLFHLVEAGSGVLGGDLSYTMYLGNRPLCRQASECLSVCKDQAKDQSRIVSAKCVKFVGNFNNYCCCYTSTTKACCKNGSSGLDCNPRLKPKRSDLIIKGLEFVQCVWFVTFSKVKIVQCSSVWSIHLSISIFDIYFDFCFLCRYIANTTKKMKIFFSLFTIYCKSITRLLS